jgi:lysozyme
MEPVTDILSQLLRDEGFRSSPYIDTRGNNTVGVGHNLDSNPLPNETYPLTVQRAKAILADDVARIWGTMQSHLPWVRSLPDVYAGVLTNMAFNMGVGGLLGFRTTLGHVQAGRYEDASVSVLQSAWATQVGARAQRLSLQLKTGVWQ